MQDQRNSRQVSNSTRGQEGRATIWAIVAIAMVAAGVLAYSRGPNRNAPMQALAPDRHGSAIGSEIATESSTTLAKSTPAEPVAKRDFIPINFTLLSLFNFQETEEMHDLRKYPQASAKTMEQIPSYVKTYDGRKVELEGYMMPITMKDGLVTDFLLMKNQNSCCYGIVPQMNEWVEVHMTGKGVKDNMDVVISISGTFHVGELRTGKGLLTGIYKMEGEKMEIPTPDPEDDAVTL